MSYKQCLLAFDLHMTSLPEELVGLAHSWKIPTPLTCMSVDLAEAEQAEQAGLGMFEAAAPDLGCMYLIQPFDHLHIDPHS
jgi:hypothetical protein